MAFTHERARPFMHFNNALVWISSVIVMGILSYFLHHYGHDLGSHIVYEEVIAVLTVAFWIPVALLSHGGLRQYSLPTNLVFSYLWLTAFIFTAQDWSRGNAYFVTFGGSYHLKHTVEAFSFLAFFFLFLNVIIEGTTFFGSGTTASGGVKTTSTV